jgi:hypothetical protein
MKADIPNPKTSDGFGSFAVGCLVNLAVCYQPVADVDVMKVSTVVVADVRVRLVN